MNAVLTSTEKPWHAKMRADDLEDIRLALAASHRRQIEERDARERQQAEMAAHWRDQFTAAVKKITADHGVAEFTAREILSSIACGQVPGFKARFDDEL